MDEMKIKLTLGNLSEKEAEEMNLKCRVTFSNFVVALEEIYLFKDEQERRMTSEKKDKEYKEECKNRTKRTHDEELEEQNKKKARWLHDCHAVAPVIPGLKTVLEDLKNSSPEKQEEIFNMSKNHYAYIVEPPVKKRKTESD